MTARVTVVVATTNRRDELDRALSYHDDLAILVDNGSTDGTAAFVRRRFPRMDVVKLGRNLGAPARNPGVRRATTPYVAFADAVARPHGATKPGRSYARTCGVSDALAPRCSYR
ncbi:glycosyltransferase family 2 protein [Planotetraspora sp. A-T 1434]|uniref:glycosyltransferase family 2 protein n=1 Tax=Planotetraspora sp. A-T 1434 TaxID=2979219 RepID=UPI0021BE1840|nr:glycosyltransferase family A protein [Planotetraspora sp. A-T 1434]MCT9931666.1 glycosyltransferase family 2 protein [Planotetraspora sp. A-T 1434]